MSKTKSIVVTILTSILILVVAFFTFVSFPIPNSVKNYNSILSTIGQGIDISGGYYVVLTPKNTSSDKSDNVVEDAMNILRTRLDKKGYTEAVISVQDGDKIRVEIPQVDDADEVLNVIGQTGELTFEDSAGKEWLNGEDHIKGAYVAQDTQNGGYVVVLEFTAKGQAKFAEATKTIVNATEGDKTLYIKLGGETVSSPTVSEELNSKTAQITGYSDYESAESIAAVIDSGRLPISYEVSESRSISSKIGDDAITKSALAGAVGLAVVFVLLIVLYGGMGVAASVSLVVFVLVYIIFLAIIPGVQLTLPGIAGILLSIGMAVDANIVIFERVKEEYKQGRTVMASLQQGYKRAFVTVFDSNVTTIFAALVLWLLCPGTIKGFAITLLVGIVLSLFCGVLVTRWFIRVYSPLAKDEVKFLNLKRNGGGLND